MTQQILRSMFLAGVMALAFSPAPVLAADPQATPTPKPLPIKKTTVELQAPEAKQKSSGAVHFERPPLMNRSFRLVPQRAEDAREMAAPAPAAPAAQSKPAPTPTPTPTPTPAGRR